MTSKTLWRAHRFVPLSELIGTDVWRAGVPMQTAVQFRSSAAEGFQQGVDRGFREGHESGLASGRESGIAQGIEAGRSKGAEQGRREVLARFETLAAPIEAMHRSLQALQDDYEAALRKEVVDLVAKVAREVIRCELALQPAQLLSLVDEALATLPRVARKGIEVYLNSEDLERITQLSAPRAARWNLLADPQLQPGECRIRAGGREADAGCRQRLEACMEQISTQLLPQTDQPQAAG
jgi:flagellar assembly protein FliH